MIAREHQTKLGTIKYWLTDELKTDEITLVFLPGLTADHRLFDKQIEAFEGKYNLFVWDAPGHNESRPFALEFSIADKARWLDEILTKENIKYPVIIGQSMGGYVGQAYCELFPDKLKGYVSIDSAPLQLKFMKGWELKSLKWTGPMYRSYPWKLLLKHGSEGCATSKYGINLMREMMLCYSHKEYSKLAGHGFSKLAEAIEADLKYEIKCPALLICGDADRAGYTIRYNEEWHADTGIPLKWLKGAGHNSNTDCPDETNQIISEFLKQVE